jgi:methionine sulfoxide reductase heme-binding subunit
MSNDAGLLGDAPPPPLERGRSTPGSRRTAARARRPSVPWLKVAVWVAGLLPLVVLLRRAFTGGLGADPIQFVTHHTGWWGLVFLLATLAVTPVRRLTGWNRIIGIRRALGLFAFFYVALHFAVYLFDQEGVLAYVVEDIRERPYITVGFAAFVLLVPLAVTSTRGMIRRLGGKRWQRLHRLVYLSAALGVLHFLWLVKADLREPLIFGAVLILLLALRLPWLRRES